MVRECSIFICSILKISYDRERYVCVEPGYVRGFVKLQPGQLWAGRQVLATI